MSETSTLQEVNLSDFLSILKENQEKFKTNFVVPSLNKEVVLKPMNSVHFKSIINSALSGVFTTNKFNTSMYEIIKDVFDPSIPLSSLNIYDKNTLLLELRCNNVSNIFKTSLVNNNNESKEFIIDLKEHLKNLLNQKYDVKTQVVEEKNVSVELDYPSIEIENLFDRYFDAVVINDTTKKYKEREIPTLMFFYYITQYIKSVTVDGTFINLSNKPIRERLNLIESSIFPTIVLQKIIERINEYFEKNLSKIVEISITENDQEYKGIIELNPSFFT